MEKLPNAETKENLPSLPPHLFFLFFFLAETEAETKENLPSQDEDDGLGVVVGEEGGGLEGGRGKADRELKLVLLLVLIGYIERTSGTSMSKSTKHHSVSRLDLSALCFLSEEPAQEASPCSLLSAFWPCFLFSVHHHHHHHHQPP